jgi:hypothetical protein
MRLSISENLKAWGKKHLVIGVISQIIVTVIAACVALIEGFTIFIIGIIMVAPGGKYGPPPTPTPEIIVKYGAPMPTPDSFLSGLATPEGIIGILVVLGSLLLYAWTLIGWVFWGSLLYIRMKEKK